MYTNGVVEQLSVEAMDRHGNCHTFLFKFSVTAALVSMKLKFVKQFKTLCVVYLYMFHV